MPEELKIQLEESRKEVSQLKEALELFRQDYQDLKEKVWRNDFSTLKVYDQKLQCNNLLNLKNFSTTPLYGEVGDLAVVSATLKICTSATPYTHTWTNV